MKDNKKLPTQQELIEFIERIESLTSDRDVANKIHRFLVSKGIWTTFEDTQKHLKDREPKI